MQKKNNAIETHEFKLNQSFKEAIVQQFENNNTRAICEKFVNLKSCEKYSTKFRVYSETLNKYAFGFFTHQRTTP